MLLENVQQTMVLAHASLIHAKGGVLDPLARGLYLESLGISREEKEGIVRLFQSGEKKIDPVVSFLVAATNGNAYRPLIGNLREYPIPHLPLLPSPGSTFLDIGCNWGRWCVAAARKGYYPVGIDPSLGAVMAARRVARQLGISARYVVGDARFLPFRDDSFDTVFSYSVLQHFNQEDAQKGFQEMGRVLKPDGTCMVQMANKLGLRSLWVQVKRGFREAKDFEVRYRSVSELKRIFKPTGKRFKVSIAADCFFGLGLQKSDTSFTYLPLRMVIYVSEALKAASRLFPPLRWFADSVYIHGQGTH